MLIECKRCRCVQKPHICFPCTWLFISRRGVFVWPQLWVSSRAITSNLKILYLQHEKTCFFRDKAGTISLFLSFISLSWNIIIRILTLTSLESKWTQKLRGPEIVTIIHSPYSLFLFFPAMFHGYVEFNYFTKRLVRLFPGLNILSSLRSVKIS